jgi:hypothetical protein
MVPCFHVTAFHAMTIERVRCLHVGSVLLLNRLYSSRVDGWYCSSGGWPNGPAGTIGRVQCVFLWWEFAWQHAQRLVRQSVLNLDVCCSRGPNHPGVCCMCPQRTPPWHRMAVALWVIGKTRTRKYSGARCRVMMLISPLLPPRPRLALVRHSSNKSCAYSGVTVSHCGCGWLADLLGSIGYSSRPTTALACKPCSLPFMCPQAHF